MPEPHPHPAPDDRVSPADGLTPSVADPNVTTGDEATSASPTLPTLLTQRYQLLDEIARGGMGVIWRAVDTALSREVAIKVLQDKYALDSGAVRRFADEARITAQLQHPAIPPIHDIGTLPDGRPFLAMKLIKGQTLDKLLRARPEVASERGRFVAVFEQVCQAVAYAHAHGVLHRDLKPGNVMVGAFGEVQVMDWGLAKVLASRERPRAEADPEQTQPGTQVVSPRNSDALFTQVGSVLGTPAYMPPEQAIGAVDQIDAQSDVFGLGGILAMVLTGWPPFVGDSSESARQLAAKGKVQACFARLDGCGADPELIALCKHCLAPDKEERPADGSAVALTVAQLRAAADERARRAELDKVRVESEKAAAEARALERRKRRQLGLGAAAALVLAAVGGLSAVLVVQRRANDDLAAKNRDLAAEQAKVQARFELAQKAIATFHTGVSEDVLLKNEQFKELRNNLLKEAAGFYGDLEKLLEGQTDAKSQRLLAEGYFQLGRLTDKIGSRPEALAVHRKALALRRELATEAGADVPTRLDVARSLEAVGSLLFDLGDSAGALAAYEDQRDIAQALEGEPSSDAVQALLGRGHNAIGRVLGRNKKRAEALSAYQKALAIQQKLAEANPTVTEFQSALAWTHNNIAIVWHEMGKPEEALKSHEQALAIRQKLVDTHPTVTKFQSDLATSHYNIGYLWMVTDRSGEALKAYEKAREIQEKMVQAHPAVTQFQSELATSYDNIGQLLQQEGKLAAALEVNRKGLAIWQKMVDANPAVVPFQHDLAISYNNLGGLLALMGKPEEGLAALEKARDIRQRLADAYPDTPDFQYYLARSYMTIGEFFLLMKRFAEALAALNSGLAISQKLADTSPSNSRYTNMVGNCSAFRGKAYARAGRPAEAAADLRKALDFWAKDKNLDLSSRFERARARALLAGLGADQKSGVTAAEAAVFADQAAAELQEAAQDSWAAPDELKELDFDVLRKRADFQRLVKDLEAKAAAARRTSPDNPPPQEKK